MAGMDAEEQIVGMDHVNRLPNEAFPGSIASGRLIKKVQVLGARKLRSEAYLEGTSQ